MALIEIWMPVKDYEGLYEVSSYGRIKAMPKLWGNGYKQYKREKILNCKDNGFGYSQTQLYRKSIPKTHYVHRIVATSFIPNPNGYKEVNHKDGNKYNCNVDNLEWCSRLQNEQHAWGTGLKVKSKFGKRVIQYDLNGSIIREWSSATQASENIKVHQAHISKCCRGGLRQTGGFKWSFA